MKHVLVLALLALVVSCTKENPHVSGKKKKVKISFFESGVTVVFTSALGTYTFDEMHDTQKIPDTTYQICATWGGGCGGLRITKEGEAGEENVLLVMPSGGTECVSGQTLAEQYYASVNCE